MDRCIICDEPLDRPHPECTIDYKYANAFLWALKTWQKHGGQLKEEAPARHSQADWTMARERERLKRIGSFAHMTHRRFNQKFERLRSLLRNLKWEALHIGGYAGLTEDAYDSRDKSKAKRTVRYNQLVRWINQLEWVIGLLRGDE